MDHGRRWIVAQSHRGLDCFSLDLGLPRKYCHSFFRLPKRVPPIAFADVDVYGGISKRLRGVGLSAIASGYMGSTYYTMLLAWVAHAFFDTFRDDGFWTDGASGSEASEYFMDRIIGKETLDPDDPRPTRVVWKNVGCAFLVWVIIYVCVIVGIKWMGRIVS